MGVKERYYPDPNNKDGQNFKDYVLLKLDWASANINVPNHNEVHDKLAKWAAKSFYLDCVKMGANHDADKILKIHGVTKKSIKLE